MKTEKLYTDLYTVTEFIEYYNGAGKRELNQALRSNLKRSVRDSGRKNEELAIRTLLN